MGDWNEAVLVIQDTVEITEEQTVAKKSDGDPKKNKKTSLFCHREKIILLTGSL
jgi:hypothetical protein